MKDQRKLAPTPATPSSDPKPDSKKDAKKPAPPKKPEKLTKQQQQQQLEDEARQLEEQRLKDQIELSRKQELEKQFNLSKELSNLGGTFKEFNPDSDQHSQHYSWLLPCFFKYAETSDSTKSLTYLEVTTVSVTRNLYLD